MDKVICECGTEIPDDAIEYNNLTNDEGEDAANVSAICPKCGKEKSAYAWGWFEDLEEAKQQLIEGN